jgi:hypothetical protein
MKFWIAPLAIVALSGSAQANQLDDDYAQLKDAQAAKNVEMVRKLAPEASKLARAEAALPQPADASQVADWKQRVEFAKQVDIFSEYALASTAVAVNDPATTVDLVDLLLAQSPKSQYLAMCASSYLSALGKQGGAAKQLAGAQKILNGSPNDEDALYALATGNMSGPYATRLIAVMKSKGKPEGVAAEDWDRKKNQLLGQGYYIAGAAACTKNTWTDCDKDLRAALPYLGKDQGTAANVYFYLGLANYKLGQLTGDRSKIQEGEKFSEQSAAMPGPMQQQAARNVQAMKQELAQPRR